MLGMQPFVATALADAIDIAHETAYDAMLSAASVRLAFMAHLKPYQVTASGTVDLYLSDVGVTTGASDTPALTYFDARLAQPFQSSRTVVGRRLGGRGQLRSASMSIDATDRVIEVDGTEYTIPGLFSNFALDGRDITIKMGRVESIWHGGVQDVFSSMLTVFDGTARQWQRTDQGSISIDLRGTALLLDTPVQQDTYDGTGDLEGSAAIKGQRPPVCFGECFNVPATRVDPDSNQLLYQVHSDASGDGAQINAVTAVKAAGVDLTLADSGTSGDYATVSALLAASAGSVSDDIEPGEYATCLAEGYFRLGSTPGGPVTADVQGAVIDGAYLTSIADIALAMIQDYGAQLADDVVDIGSFNTLSATVPYPVHYFTASGQDTTVADALTDLLGSVEASWGDRRDGKIAVSRVQVPSGDATLTIDSGDIVEGSWQWLPMPADVRPAVKELTIGYAQNFAPNTNLPAGVTGDDRTRLENRWKTVVATRSLPQHLEGVSLRIDTRITDDADASTYAEALIDFYNGNLRRVRFACSHKAYRLNIGDKVQITYAQEDVDEQLCTVLAVEPNAGQMTVGLEVMFKNYVVFGLNEGVNLQLNSGHLLALGAS